VPSEKQNCHDEQKKVCELEQRSQPKQVKKYVYTKHCRPVPKTVCDNIDQKSLQPSCVPMSRKQCSYSPEERCENIPKKHCFKIPYQVKTMQCGQDHGSDGGFANRGLNNDHSQGDGYAGRATMDSEMSGQFQSSMDEYPRSEGSYANNRAMNLNEY